MVNEPPKYRSSRSVAKNQTIPIDVNDPRLKPGKIGMVKARSGAEIEIVNLANVNSNSANFRVLNGNISGGGLAPDLNLPPINDMPPSVYPGGSGPQAIVPTDPANVTATWSGDTLNISFTWDPTLAINYTMSQFVVSLTDTLGDTKTYGGFPIAAGVTSQTIAITPSINETMFNIFTPNLTAISVKVTDPLNNSSSFVAAASIPAYTLSISTPTISVTATSSGYSVVYTTPNSSSFSGIDIWEIESSSLTAPTITYEADGVTPSNYNRVYFNSLNPAIIKTIDYNKRWVIARFTSNGQVYTSFSTAVSVTPNNPVAVNSIANNVPIQQGGSIYSGNIDGSGNLTSQGYILNNNGITFYNGITNTTTINGSTGLLQTISADIGGWNVDQYTINKTGISGKGNIVLDSQNGYVYVSDANTPNYTAGINSASASDAIVFWAGQGLSGSQPNPASSSNAFRVSLGGTLYATGAQITGNITATSGGTSGNVIKLDSTNDYISMSTSGSAYSSYIVPRNNNIYITAPSNISAPWTNGVPGQIDSNGPTNGSYFSAGSNFVDYWNASNKTGAGLFTGPWNYFAGGSSNPFISATTTGIQLSAAPEIGILLDNGNTNNLSPAVAQGQKSLLIYTAKNSGAPYSPTTQYGAWAAFTNNLINLAASNYTFMALAGNNYSGSNFSSNSIYIQASNGRTYTSISLNSNPTNIGSGIDSAYAGPSRIILSATAGVQISGLPLQKDQTSLGTYLTDYNGNNPTWGMGTLSRQRMIVEDPYDGISRVGMAVYYQDSNGPYNTLPTVNPFNNGYYGDLWVVF